MCKDEDKFRHKKDERKFKEEDMMNEITSPTSWDGNEQTQQELNEKGNVISKMKKDTYKIVKEGRKEGLSESAIREKLTKSSSVEDHVEDFKDSDAPQFKGKSLKKIKQMALASFLSKQKK